jgi:hypothetical protein
MILSRRPAPRFIIALASALLLARVAVSAADSNAAKTKSGANATPGKSKAAKDKAKRAKKAEKKQPEPTEAERAAKKKQALATLRKEIPARSENFSFTREDLDQLLQLELARLAREPAPPASDEVFLRRVSLDLTGKLPTPDAVRDFVADSHPAKRAKRIDELLASDDYARNWARYWHDVLLYRSTVNPKKIDAGKLEDWLAEQFAKDRGWDKIAAELVMADGKKPEVGPDNFLLAQDNSPTQMASETARVFMGVNLQCAECHDHPFDRWKREQFHEMAAFFAKDKYYMPDAKDPAQKTEMKPRFLLGETPRTKLSGDDKRIAVAAYLIYNPRNYWFARAYVNRLWNELFGDGFYRVDSLGPDNEVMYPMVVNRLSAAFRAMEFRPRWLFRTIMNSEAYQRETRTPESASDRFAALRPTRLRGDQVADAVEQALQGTKARDRVRAEFGYDPSLPQEDLDGSIQQALILMNNRAIQARVSKSGGSLVPELLKLKSNEELVRELYLRVLARQPSEAERARVLAYFKSIGNRSDATEDLVWVLLNSAEFLTKR